MKTYLIFFCLSFILCYSKGIAQQTQQNQLTPQEKAEGWMLLFDGESFEHWRGYNMDRFHYKVWKTEERMLVFSPGEEAGVDTITKKKFGNFEFKAEWKIEEGLKNGIFHHVVEQPEYAIYWSGLELQLLDNADHANMMDFGTQ